MRLSCFSKTCRACSLPLDTNRDAYVAGILDGEGSISIQRRGEVRVDVGMAEKAIPLLNWLHRTYGGSVRPTGKETEKWQARYCWTLTTDPAICLLRLVAPYMTIKREIAQAILKADMVDRDERKGTRRHWTEARFAAFEEARATALRVNKKGPPESRDWIARRVGGRWETRQGDLLTGLSETFSGDWPQTGGMRNGCVSGRPTWVPATAAPGGSASRGDAWLTPAGMAGLDHTGKAGAGGEFAQQATNWHTPTTMAAKSVPYQRVNGKDVLILTGQAENWITPKASDGKNGGPNQRGSKGDLMLPSMVAHWPTPSAAVANDGESPETWHARAEKLAQKHGNGNGAGLPLTVATAQWPTPVSSDQRSQLGASLPDRMANRTASPSLSQVVTHSLCLPQAQQTPDGPPSSPATRNSPRHLNPLFGAWLMGWPSTWVIAEPHASSASATELFRCKLQWHLSLLCGEPGQE